MIENLPKGALPDAPDNRDFHIETLGALPPADFSKGSGLPRPPLKDQNSSDACVPHAWSYYHWQLKSKDFSCRDLFARIAQAYGAVIRDGGLAIVKQGQATTDLVPDPKPETPENMRDKTGVTPHNEVAGEELNSFVVPKDIDSIASAILAYKGIVFGVQGTNAGWQNLIVPEPPKITDSQSDIWGHALYAVDFHIHQNLDGTTEKCIICPTTWPDIGITEHHIRERYFAGGWTFNPWTLIPKSLTPKNMALAKKTLNLDGEIGVFISVSDPASLADLNTAFGVNIAPSADGSIPTDIVAHKQ